MDLEEKRGLWDNIHAKRKRIAAGSGEHMRKPGSKGAPTSADLKNSQTKTESYTKRIVKQSIREMLESQCPCGGNCECDKPKPKKNVDENKEYENPTGGLSQKGRDHYNNTTGSHLQAPVTKEPSKLKKGSKSYNRRKSFCARMGGMKKRLTGAKTANDPDSRINKALRKWNC
jgi:hypothetical protein